MVPLLDFEIETVKLDILELLSMYLHDVLFLLLIFLIVTLDIFCKIVRKVVRSLLHAA